VKKVLKRPQRVSMLLEADDLKILDRAAKKLDRSRTSVVRMLIRAHLDASRETRETPR
jgi:hypothetical protein